ncbi:NAD(P)/FAD-dependent oxidoreductase [bacterium]|nr:NAD(P)/FAD-dependent oxidoreductase [bacterium]
MNRRSSQIAIVGNGMASFELCRRLVEANAAQHLRITVFGGEPRPAYDRVHLTEYLSGKSDEDLLMRPADWYAEQGIELRVGDPVCWIDRSHQTVRSESGFEIHYDQVVFATGSRPFVPPIPGTDSPNVFLYREIEDLQAIAAASQTATSAAVLGGGLLGLEAAKALLDLGVQTHVLEVAGRLMPRQLDDDGSQLLKEKIASLGVGVRLVARAESIERLPEGRLQINFAHGESLVVDMIVISAGIRPRDELAREIGLSVHDRGGIEIDDHCLTSDPKIYAIGECALHRGIIYGLVGPCYRMAEVVASQLTEGTDLFTGADTSATLKLMGVEVATLGLSLDASPGGSIVTYKDDNVCRKLLVENSRIIGAMSVGPWPEVNTVRDMIEARKGLWPWQLRRFERLGRLLTDSQPLPISQWPDESTVCSCIGVTCGQLKQAIGEGHDSVEAIAAHTRASTVCGSCQPLLAELCGVGQSVAPASKMPAMMVVSAIAAVLLLAITFTPSMAAAESVQDSWHQIDLLWRDSIAKQITGYTLVAIMLLGLVFSLRKRIRWITWGSFANWRFAHAALGTACVVGMIAHTGMSLGSNLNFALAITFIFMNLLGAATGALTVLETRTTGNMAMLVRRWRPRMTYLHIALFWPVPALLLFHIVATYYF